MSRDTENRWSELMRAANAGDEGAYRALLGELAPLLRKIAAQGLSRAGTGNADVEDVMQEVLLAVHLKRHTWVETEPFSPWLHAIARNKVIDCLRRRGRRVVIEIEDVAHLLAADPVPDATARRDVQRMVGSLNGRQRDVVGMISLDGASIEETAGQLGMTEGAVRVALHRGIAALSALYGKASS